MNKLTNQNFPSVSGQTIGRVQYSLYSKVVLIGSSLYVSLFVYRKVEDGKYRGFFWGLDQVFTRDFKCMSVQGLASILKGVLLKTNARCGIMIF